MLCRNIFLGETFSCYISVHNDSTKVVKDILVKVLEGGQPLLSMQSCRRWGSGPWL